MSTINEFHSFIILLESRNFKIEVDINIDKNISNVVMYITHDILTNNDSEWVNIQTDLLMNCGFNTNLISNKFINKDKYITDIIDSYEILNIDFKNKTDILSIYYQILNLLLIPNICKINLSKMISTKKESFDNFCMEDLFAIDVSEFEKLFKI